MPPGSCGSTTLMRAWMWMCYHLVPNTGDPASGQNRPLAVPLALLLLAPRPSFVARVPCTALTHLLTTRGWAFSFSVSGCFQLSSCKCAQRAPLAAALLAAALAPLVLAPPQPRRAAAPPDADAPAGGLEGAAARCAARRSATSASECRSAAGDDRASAAWASPLLGSTEPLPAAGASASWLDLCDPIF